MRQTSDTTIRSVLLPLSPLPCPREEDQGEGLPFCAFRQRVARMRLRLRTARSGSILKAGARLRSSPERFFALRANDCPEKVRSDFDHGECGSSAFPACRSLDDRQTLREVPM